MISSYGLVFATLRGWLRFAAQSSFAYVLGIQKFTLPFIIKTERQVNTPTTSTTKKQDAGICTRNQTSSFFLTVLDLIPHFHIQQILASKEYHKNTSLCSTALLLSTSLLCEIAKNEKNNYVTAKSPETKIISREISKVVVYDSKWRTKLVLLQKSEERQIKQA